MDLSKHKSAFEKMDYDASLPSKVSLPNTKSTIIVTQHADLDSASDFVAGCFQAEDLNQIRSILVQASVEEKFISLLRPKLKTLNTASLDEATQKRLSGQFSTYAKMGLELIHLGDEKVSGLRAALVKCPRSLISSDDLPIISLEVFRTTKEAISFAKAASSVGLWCENISISFEYITALPNACQIWLNCTHGATHPKIPFYNGQIVCEDAEIRAKAAADSSGATIQVADNIHFQTTFRAKSFQTVAIPFGETFAN